MKLSELVDAVAKDTGASKADADKAVKAVFANLTNVLAAKDTITVPGFGTFSTKDNPARDARNPATGETIKVAEKTVAKFKPGKGLTDRLNG